MILFHATTQIYSPSEVISGRKNAFYPNAVAALELARPNGAPSREECVFATDNLNFSYLFALKQYERDKIRIYEVELSGSHKSPMALVNAIEKRILAGRDASVLVSEYWNPSTSWSFWEYFGSQMKVIAKLHWQKIRKQTVAMTDDDRQLMCRSGKGIIIL